MINPFKIIDWPLRKFSIVFLVLLLSYLGSVGINLIGLNIPILQELTGFIILAFLPGILIMRLMKIKNLNSVENILFSVGLSLSFLMFSGCLINEIYPLFGFLKPLSTISIIATFIISIVFLFVLCYINNDVSSKIELINLKKPLSIAILFISIIPFLSIFGTELLNTQSSNLLLLVMIFIIAIIPFFVINDYISTKYYSYTIFIISISLLFHQSLVSMYITGWDIQFEYYSSSLVLKNSIWNSFIPTNINSMLSISILPTMIYKITNIELDWIFKIIYPLLFSLVPLGMYQIFQKQMNEKNSFLSVFFFISFFVFYTEMISLARQEIAEIFFVLIILLIVNNSMQKKFKSVLIIIFSFSMIVSHYGLTYLFLFSLVSVWLILLLYDNMDVKKIYSQFYKKNRNKPANFLSSLNISESTIKLSFVLLFIVLTFTWYVNTSDSSNFVTIVNVGDHIINSILLDFFEVESSQPLSIITGESPSLLHKIDKYFHLLSLFFISIGILYLLLTPWKLKFRKEYAAFSYIFFIICLFALIIPSLAKQLNTGRLLHIILIILSPFFVIGCITFIKSSSKIFRISWTKKNINTLKIVSVFLSIYLLFNTGFIYEITKDNPRSIALNDSLDSARYNNQEYSAAMWLNNVKIDQQIYADGYKRLIFNRIYYKKSTSFNNNSNIPPKSYIFMGTYNIKNEEVYVHEIYKSVTLDSYISNYGILKNTSKIFDNSNAQIFLK